MAVPTATPIAMLLFRAQGQERRLDLPSTPRKMRLRGEVVFSFDEIAVNSTGSRDHGDAEMSAEGRI